MRTLLVAVATTVVAAGAGLYAAGAAQEEKDRPGGVEVLVEHFMDMHLTDAQEEKIENARKEYGPKVQAAAKTLHTLVKEEMDKAHAVLTPEQKTKLQELKDERKEKRIEGVAARIAHLKELDLTDAEVEKIEAIRKDYRPKIVAAVRTMEGFLTPEQKTARKEAMKAANKRAREGWAALKLTDEQKEKVKTACQEVRTNVQAELKEIHEVLSEEQKAKLAELKEERRDRIRDRRVARMAHAKELELTDDQKTKLREIRQEFRPRIHEAGNELRAAVREEAAAILAVLKEKE
jgi:Spy/CpxP family protein refolding chaperone